LKPHSSAGALCEEVKDRAFHPNSVQFCQVWRAMRTWKG
jgi:hypothetical protein